IGAASSTRSEQVPASENEAVGHRGRHAGSRHRPAYGSVTGANAKKEMVKSKLPNTVLGKIWKLADIDKDGMLDDEEFALANHLIKVKLEGHELPSELPAHLVPPSKRKVPE
uniref:EH domain-containing protein n=1 Tax=Sinocyclocheilus anshuiensis TaxID=1608454 RepID=A0A671QCU8_9TELE